VEASTAAHSAPSPTRPLRLVVAGGGTGGHVLPAIAVIAELQRRNAITDLLWIGSVDGLEREAAQRAGIPFASIPTGKLRRYLSLRNVLDAVRVPLGVAASRRLLRRFHPDVVFSTGGFVSVPTVAAAVGVAPVLTHEQTAILGLATRLDARVAAVLAISYDQTRSEASKLHRRVMVTGNPVRPELSQGSRLRGMERFGFDPDLPLVYVTGGARGASPVNQRIAKLLPGLLEDTQILHQTGPAAANADAAALADLRRTLPERLRRRYQVIEFIGGELPDVYAATDLVVGRAGAGTIAELAYVGKPAILIPLPGAGSDEQAVNARVLGAVGAAVVLPQSDATPERLHADIAAILRDDDRRARMAAAARTVARPDAASRLADALIALADS
jgi:UDP-N-acetylglucosamine--N-acetylmuramyl-(pentapeptide) pyrophosphoryl-undecaprenol N-acetylglucosamine transferase